MTSRGLIRAVAAAAAGVLLTGATAVAGDAGPATDAATTAGAVELRTEPARTALTLEVTDCDGCRVVLTQAREGRDEVWQAPARRVKDGKVSWNIASHRTEGLSMNIHAPWESGPIPAATVVFRYAGLEVGERVQSDVAKKKRRASVCWAGTDASEVTIKIRAERMRMKFFGNGPFRALRAYTSVTQDWLDPMMFATRGRTGTRDATYCA